MKLIKSKSGMGLPMVLGITVFVIGLAATLMSYIIFQSRLVEIEINQSEDYQNAVSDVRTALNIISREQNLSPEFLVSLENYFNISIENYNEHVLMITSMINQNDQIISYMTGTVQEVSTFDTLFEHTGSEDNFVLSPLVTPTNLLTTFVPEFIDNSFHWIEPESGFTSFDEIMDYILELTVQGSTFHYRTPHDLESQWQPNAWWYWYVDGDVEILPGSRRENNLVKNLRVQDGQILFINGNLTMHENSTIYGNVVVNGNLTIVGKGNSEQGIEGTLYVNGDVNIAKNLRLGTEERPSFVFAEGSINLGNTVNGYGYFLSHTFDGKQGNIQIIGGVYTSGSKNIPPQDIEPNEMFNETFLYDYAIPSQISIDPNDQTPPGEVTTTFKFTYPKLR